MITPEHLKKTMDTIGLTDTAIANIAGISKSTLYRWLNGSVPVHPGVMMLLEILAIDDVWNSMVVRHKLAKAMNKK